MSTAAYAEQRTAESDDLYTTAKHLEALLSSEGWKWLQNLLATQQQKKVLEAKAPPGREGIDSYALRQARIGGILEGLQYAYDAPHQVLQIARRELGERQRRLAEMAAREEEQ